MTQEEVQDLFLAVRNFKINFGGIKGVDRITAGENCIVVYFDPSRLKVPLPEEFLDFPVKMKENIS